MGRLQPRVRELTSAQRAYLDSVELPSGWQFGLMYNGRPWGCGGGEGGLSLQRLRLRYEGAAGPLWIAPDGALYQHIGPDDPFNHFPQVPVGAEHHHVVFVIKLEPGVAAELRLPVREAPCGSGVVWLSREMRERKAMHMGESEGPTYERTLWQVNVSFQFEGGLADGLRIATSELMDGLGALVDAAYEFSVEIDPVLVAAACA